DRTANRVGQAMLQGDLSAKRPTEEPGCGQVAILHKIHRCGKIEALSFALTKLALACASRRRGAPRVETQHREIGKLREPPRSLADHVRVHVAARGRQRM